MVHLFDKYGEVVPAEMISFGWRSTGLSASSSLCSGCGSRDGDNYMSSRNVYGERRGGRL